MIETKFKQTELGLIPEDWEVCKIGDFTDIVTGATPSTENSDYWNGHIRWMNSSELNNKIIFEVHGRISKEGYDSASTHMLPTNCVLIGLAGQGKTRGTSAINKVELCTNQSIGAILPSENIDSDYLYLYMDGQYQKLRTISSGDGGRGGLSKTLLLNFEIVKPNDIGEQKLVAEVLNDVDKLIRELDTLIEKKRSIMQGAMQDLLTARRRLPGFSQPWCQTQLKRLVSMNSGGTPSTAESSYYGGNIPFLSISDITSSGKFLKYTTKSITQLALENTSARLFRKGTLVLSMYASIGKVCFVDTEVAISQAILGFCPIESNLDINFLYYMLLFSKEDLANSGQTGTQSNLNKNIVQNYTISLPHTKEEQTAIASILSDMDAEIEELEAKRDKYIAVRQGMMQQLLTGKIRLI